MSATRNIFNGFILASITAGALLLVQLPQNAYAQEIPQEPELAVEHGANFIDADGDGYNDNAPDVDNDGVPNGQDADYVKSGNGAQNGNGRAFLDEDGDGFNDNAPDIDGDGIPNGQDADYVAQGQGAGRNGKGGGQGDHAAQNGVRSGGKGHSNGNHNGSGAVSGARGKESGAGKALQEHVSGMHSGSGNGRFGKSK